jgi:hypothetical protein
MNLVIAILVLAGLWVSVELLALTFSPIEKATVLMKRRLANSRNLFARILLYPIGGALEKLWLAMMAVLLVTSAVWGLALVVKVLMGGRYGWWPLAWLLVAWLPLMFIIFSTTSLLAEVWRWVSDKGNGRTVESEPRMGREPDKGQDNPL